VLILATQNCRPSKLPKSTKVQSHGNNVRDVIFVHMISWDTETNRQTDTENVKHQHHLYAPGTVPEWEDLGTI